MDKEFLMTHFPEVGCRERFSFTAVNPSTERHGLHSQLAERRHPEHQPGIPLHPQEDNPYSVKGNPREHLGGREPAYSVRGNGTGRPTRQSTMEAGQTFRKRPTTVNSERDLLPQGL